MRPVYFVPESKTIGELLHEMRTDKHLMAVVINEYGSICGIVTIDQLIEHIVGEVQEELTEVKKAYEIFSSSVYKVQGSARIEDVNSQLQLNIPRGDYQTVAGYTFTLFGRLPKEGEQIDDGHVRILIREVSGNKISSVFIIRKEESETSGEGQ